MAWLLGEVVVVLGVEVVLETLYLDSVVLMMIFLTEPS